MKYRHFPGTNVGVSEIGFGVWTVSSPWWGITDDQAGIGLLRKAYDLGITFFDTADNYGNGKGETLLAEALEDRLDTIVIGSKWGYNFYDFQRQGQQELPQDFSVPYLKRSIEASLKRLRRDHIDIYNLHNCRVDVIRRDEVFEALEGLKKEGKIRAYGVALGPALNERQIEEGKVAITQQKVHCVQIIYNLFEQMLGLALFPCAKSLSSSQDSEKSVPPPSRGRDGDRAGRREAAGEEVVGAGGGNQLGGTRFLVRVPHSSGLLEGKFDKNTTFSTTDHRSFRKKEWLEEGLKKAEAIGFLTQGNDKTIGQAALQFVLSEPTVASVLPNIYNAEQLDEFAQAPGLPSISQADLQKLRELYRQNFGVQPVAQPAN